MKRIIIGVWATLCAMQLFAQGTATISAGTIVKPTGGVFIVLNNLNLVNNGTLQQQAGSGSVKFIGSVNESISGSGVTTIDSLVLAKGSSANLNVLSNISVVSQVNFTSGLLNLGNNSIDLSGTGTLKNESETSRAYSTGSGYVKSTVALNAPSSANPGNLGAVITSSANLGSTVIKRGFTSNPHLSGAILRYYDIIPTNNTGLAATLRLQYLDAELNGSVESSLDLFKSGDSINWFDNSATSRNSVINYVEKTNISDFSFWTLAPGVNNCSTSSNWLGLVNSDWNNASNWACGVVPGGSLYSVTIASSPNTPTLTGDIEINNIAFQSGMNINLGGKTLTVDGNVTGTGAFKGSTTSSMVLNGLAGVVNFAPGYGTLNNLTLSPSSSATLGATLGVYGTVTVGAGSTLNSAGYLNLKSNLSTTGRVATLTSGTITGNVVVERYIPANMFQAWRLLSVPTQGGQTFRQSWQENQAPMVVGTNGYGTLMGQTTGTGFDYVATASVASSIKTWTQSTGTWDVTVNSTNNASQTKGGYLLYIKGDRNVTPSMSTNSVNPTVLRTTGTLYQGNQSSAAVSTGKYAVIGNIYPSAIDFTALSKDTSSTGLYNTFYVWDPKLYGSNGAGAYQTFAKANGWVPTPGGGSYGYNIPNTVIEQGQAFMVIARATSNGLATVNFAETAKVAHNANVFVRAGRMNRVSATLTINGHTDPADGNTVVFGAGYTENIPKPGNMDENFAVMTDNEATSVSARATEAKDGDRVAYNLSNLKEGQQYSIEINAENFNGQQAYLEDSYLHTSTPLDMNGKTTVSFTGNSSSNGRFTIVFGKMASTPLITLGAGKISIAPNPVTGRTINLQFSNKGEGLYTVTFVNSTGQDVYTTTVNNIGNNSTQQVKLPKLVSGVYHVQISAADGASERQRIMIGE